MRYNLWLIFWTIALTTLFCYTSRADDYSFKYGMGLLDGSPTGNIKQFSFREERHEFYAVHSAAEAGLWVDNLGGGRSSAGFAKYQLGVKPGWDGDGVYGSAMWGVSVQSSTDSQLGGYAQFSQDAGIGLRDETSFIQLTYTHFSSAGIFSPNRGRDFLTLSLGVRL